MTSSRLSVSSLVAVLTAFFLPRRIGADEASLQTSAETANLMNLPNGGAATPTNTGPQR